MAQPVRNSPVHFKQTPHGDVLIDEDGAPLRPVTKTDRFSGVLLPEDTVHRPKPNPSADGEVIGPNGPPPVDKAGAELLVSVQAGVPYEVHLQAQFDHPAYDPESSATDIVVVTFPQAWRIEDLLNPETGEVPEELASVLYFNRPFSGVGWVSDRSMNYVLERAEFIASEDLQLRATIDTYRIDQGSGLYFPAEQPIEIIRSALSVREIIL